MLLGGSLKKKIKKCKKILQEQRIGINLQFL